MRLSRYVFPVMASLGFGFLYAPILILVIYSFNESKLVTVWGGFSTRWYVELFQDPQILDAAKLSLQIAASSATIALVLGVAAAMTLVRFRWFRGRTWLAGMVAAPLVMPEVITGLSLLLLFVALDNWIGWPSGRGVTTIVLAHATFGMAFVAVIVQARLRDMDRTLEEAAMDLGARPTTVFLTVTLPTIAPALVASWLLAFTLSLDDLVIASFVSGPGSSTLPMVVFSKVRLGISPDINALATLMILIVGLGGVFGFWQMRRSTHRRSA
ncbi:MAG: ABC transporter permease subunit [Gammaproteobacteria bacterium]|jgi:putrescine transport system permease protein|nr:ABC transporter permease subunit [Gammaproteobacteria bacterium]NCW72986.1 ABC transporter permease subunit [Gammaproteobacteria bacterium]